MAKYHINDAGEVGTCKARIKDCKFASTEGEGDGHYSDKQEAQEAATKKMEAQYKDVYKGYRRGEEAGMNMPDAMKRRLIEEGTQEGARVSAATIGRVLSKDNDELIRKAVVEKLSSQKLLRDMSDDESARVRKAVAMRTNNREVLAKLANDPDRSVQLAAIKNEKTPAKARKAAQDAIKAANLKNLEKARAKANEGSETLKTNAELPKRERLRELSPDEMKARRTTESPKRERLRELSPEEMKARKNADPQRERLRELSPEEMASRRNTELPKRERLRELSPEEMAARRSAPSKAKPTKKRKVKAADAKSSEAKVDSKQQPETKTTQWVPPSQRPGGKPAMTQEELDHADWAQEQQDKRDRGDFRK